MQILPQTGIKNKFIHDILSIGVREYTQGQKRLIPKDEQVRGFMTIFKKFWRILEEVVSLRGEVFLIDR